MVASFSGSSHRDDSSVSHHPEGRNVYIRTGMLLNYTKWFKKSPRPGSPDPEWSKDPNANAGQEQDWFPELEKTAKAPEEFDDLLGTTFDFSNFVKHCLKKDKLTKADIEGDRIPQDISKPLHLLGAPGRLYIPAYYFFNKDLEYLRSRSLEERKYTASFTKAKTTRISVEKEYGYGYLKEIVVKQANQKEYRFKEADFPRLYLNDIEDMFLLYYQNKLHHLDGNIQTDLAVALRFFIRRTVLKHIVKDVQLGVKSYQTKLNLTTPQISAPGVDNKEPYTIFYKPRGVIYESRNDNMCLMRENEVYKFREATIVKVRDELKYRLNNFRIGYNKDMPTRQC
ncbi:hypothetical protein Tco_1045263 [Tanacetum coccineum]|uniref:Uncharacterized protein n=1 Tax=Tanacetum coccineum TaxID=301880 RepID=A0ABQ5GS84_9ASTR